MRVTDNNGTAGSYVTYSRLDILGRVTQVTDAKGRLMTRHFYSIDGQPVHTHNIDSGHRWVLLNPAQKPIHQWDNRSNHIARVYDARQQPLEVLVQENELAEVQLTEQYFYGDASSDPYFRGRLTQWLGQDGQNTIDQYDFKGNVLSLTTQICAAYNATINWYNPQEMGDSFTQENTFDSMNRPVTQKAPNQQFIHFGYDDGGMMDCIDFDGEIQHSFNLEFAYNARGQRTLMWQGNGTKTRYFYDNDTFRLNRLLTERGQDVLQDIAYTYDPEGNIVQQTDAAQQTFYFNNAVVAPTGLYEYDALYRLVKAQGRELTNLGIATDTDFANNLAVPNPAANAMQSYNQIFTYDELGNIQAMKSKGQWTRNYVYDTATNRLLRHEGSTNVYTYDAHGNMTAMPHLTAMQWDWNDRLRCTTNGTVTTWYCYDAAGNRVRKVTEKPGGIVEDRIYAGIYERYTRKVGSTTHTRRHTFNFSDGQHRYALIDTLTIDNGITLTTPVETVRYQYDNHLGSASLELDEHAAIISLEEYHPFGTTSYRSGRTETEVALKRYKYVGKERDEETGLYYYGARYYAAWLARFVSVDPLQFKYPHYTPYQYAGNKPVSYVDLDGLEEAPAAISTYFTNPVMSKFKNIEKEIAKAEAGQHKVEAFDQRFGKGTAEHIQGNLSSFLSSSGFQNARTVASHTSTAISTTQVIFESFSKNWLSSSSGAFFKKHGDPILDLSRGKLLEQNGIYKLKNGQNIFGNSNPVRMTDDLPGAAKFLNRLSINANFISSLFEGFNKWQQTNSYYESIGGGILNAVLNWNPYISVSYTFGNMVIETDKFKADQAFYYRRLMQENKFSDGQKHKEAEALYNKYKEQTNTDNNPMILKQTNR